MKAKTACISFTCPTCSTAYNIFLRDQPNLMLLNCPTCKETVSLYDGQLLHGNDLKEKIKKIQSPEDIILMFKDIDKTLKLQKRRQQKLINNDTFKNLITNDDILNLRIDLELCKSADDVIKLICK